MDRGILQIILAALILTSHTTYAATGIGTQMTIQGKLSGQYQLNNLLTGSVLGGNCTVTIDKTNQAVPAANQPTFSAKNGLVIWGKPNFTPSTAQSSILLCYTTPANQSNFIMSIKNNYTEAIKVNCERPVLTYQCSPN